MPGYNEQIVRHSVTVYDITTEETFRELERALGLGAYALGTFEARIADLGACLDAQYNLDKAVEFARTHGLGYDVEATVEYRPLPPPATGPLDLTGVDATEAAVQTWCDDNGLRLTVWKLTDKWVLSDKSGLGRLAQGKHLGPTITRATGRAVTGRLNPTPTNAPGGKS